MATPQPSERQVVVAGTGIAATLAAIMLSREGLEPVLLDRGLKRWRVTECVPLPVIRLFSHLGLDSIIADAGCEQFMDFENEWVKDRPQLQHGPWFHFDREALAHTLLGHAKSLGTEVIPVSQTPALGYEDSVVVLQWSGIERRFRAAIDATGRACAWSRPIKTAGRHVARLFEVGLSSSPRGRVIRHPAGWAYRLCCNGSMTIGLVDDVPGAKSSIDAAVASRLEVPPENIVYLGGRPAYPQWASAPVARRRIAIGDAAFACDPIAGQGIRFAMHSVLHAIAVVSGWMHGSSKNSPTERFYQAFVRQARVRHLEFVAKLKGDASSLSKTLVNGNRHAIPERLKFSGTVRTTEVSVDRQIVRGQAVVLQDGFEIRWIGGMDILQLREMTQTPISSTALIALLANQHIKRREAISLILWCLHNGVLADF